MCAARRFIPSSELHDKVLSLQRATSERHAHGTPSRLAATDSTAASAERSDYSEHAEWREKACRARVHRSACG